MRRVAGKLARGLGYAAGAGLILLAVTAGLLRLAVIQLPRYQDDIRAWVRAEYGVDLNFSHVDARWSVLGPEFSFRNAAVSRIAVDTDPIGSENNPIGVETDPISGEISRIGDATDSTGDEADPLGDEAGLIVSAAEAAITLSPTALFSERRLDVNRLALEGAAVHVERDADGVLRVVNLPEGRSMRIGQPLADLPAATVIVTDGVIAYSDRILKRKWRFEGVRLRVRTELDGIAIEAFARPPPGVAEGIELSAQFDIGRVLEGRRPDGGGAIQEPEGDAGGAPEEREPDDGEAHEESPSDGGMALHGLEDGGGDAPEGPQLDNGTALDGREGGSGAAPEESPSDGGMALHGLEDGRGDAPEGREPDDGDAPEGRELDGAAPGGGQFEGGGALRAREIEWRLFGEARGMDIALLPELWPDLWPDAAPLQVAGDADISFWLDLVGDRAQQATLAMEVAGLRLGGAGGGDPANRATGADATDAGDAANSATGADATGGGDPAYARARVTLEGARVEAGWALSASNLQLDRSGQVWPQDADIDVRAIVGEDGLTSLTLRSGFLRLDDLAPLIAAAPRRGIAGIWAELQPRGEVSDVQARLVRGRNSWRYAATGSFADLHVAARGPWPGLQGFSGALRMDSGSGRLDLDTRDAELDWPVLFAAPFAVDELSGRWTWRQRDFGLVLSGADLIANTPHGQSRSALELTWPRRQGESPTVTLRSRIRDLDAAGATRYLPTGVFAEVSAWLGRAILAGRIPAAEVTLAGPLADFPFGNGEGRFHAVAQVEDGAMAYVENWPVAEALNGTVTFADAGWEARGSGRVFGNRSDDLRVGIEDMREPVLDLTATTRGSLDDVLRYLKEAPMIARHLGPDLERVRAAGGIADIRLALELPLLDPTAYRLDTGLEIAGGELAIDGFGPALGDIRGALRLRDGEVASRGRLTASFLDAPITIGVAEAAEPGYLADVSFAGLFDAALLQDEFNLPFVGQVRGISAWQGHVLLPENRFIQARREPLRIDLATDLVGVDLGFPEPLGKPRERSAPLEIGIVFSEADRLNVNGRLDRNHGFALSFRNREGELSFRRGSIRFGGAAPPLPSRDGLSVSGDLSRVNLDDWWALFRQQVPRGAAAGLLLGADLRIAALTILGQPLGPTAVALRQQAARWRLRVDSEPVAGEIAWSIDLGSRAPLLAQMERLHVAAKRQWTDLGPDPRKLPGLYLRAGDFAMGARRFGAFDADIRAVRDGLEIVTLNSRSDSLAMEGSGGWYQRPEGQETRLVLTASSGDVAGALEQLGMDPIVEAQEALLALNVSWPSGPTPGWEKAISGGLNLRLERGSILNLDPGAGRMVGLMSIAALPRRLALDFRDVVNRGLAFDELSGSFVIIGGDAYTDNMHLVGPVADIGLVGRTGLRDRDYEQHAVVATEPGRILPAVGFLAGTQVGAALLLFSEIFREPLSGVGRTSYCVTGEWSDPLVERLTAEQIDAGKFCADLPGLAQALEP